MKRHAECQDAPGWQARIVALDRIPGRVDAVGRKWRHRVARYVVESRRLPVLMGKQIMRHRQGKQTGFNCVLDCARNRISPQCLRYDRLNRSQRILNPVVQFVDKQPQVILVLAV